MKNKHLTMIFKIFTVIILFLCATISYTYAYNWPWDQGHDGTNPKDPGGGGDCSKPPCCKEPPCDKCKGSGSPVIFADGSYNTLFTDIKLSGTPEIELKRYYRSKHRFRTGYFGYGWSFIYEMRLLHIEGEQKYIVILMPNAQIYKFIINADGTYQSPVNTNLTLSKNTSNQFVLKEPHENTYLFNDNGQLIEITDKNQNKINITYSAGCISSVSSQDGRSLTFTKGVNGKISSVTDHTGKIVQYLYNEYGDLKSFTNVTGDTQTYTYQQAQHEPDMHLLSSISDFMGNTITTIAYDAEGKVSSLMENGLTFNYQFNDGNIVQKTDIDGTWEYKYNDQGLVVSIKDPAGNVASSIFDDNGNLTSQTDTRGNVTTYTYDTLGNILTVKKPLNSTVTYTYYKDTRLIETKTDPNGTITKYEYDAKGNITKIYYAFGTPDQKIVTNTYDANGNRLTTSDAEGNVVTFTYNNAGKVLSETKDGQILTHEYDASGNLIKTIYPWGKAKEITYDNSGRKLTEKDPEGNLVSYTYDKNGKLLTTVDARNNVTKLTYNDRGQVTKITDAAGNFRELTLDEKGRPTSIKDRNGTVRTIKYNHLGLETEVATGSFLQKFNYDANGNRIEAINANGTKTVSEYNELNRLSKRKSPLGTEAAYKYDKNGKLIAIDFQGTGINIQKTYDALGHEVSVSDSLGTIGTIKTYDKNGNVLTETDPNGNSITCEYDAFNRITKKTSSDGTWQTYRYNIKGVIDQITSSNGSITTFTHDNNGRIIFSTDIRGTYSVTYDAGGNIATRTDPNGNKTTYEYNELNMVKKETYPDGSTVTYTYFPEGQLKSITDRNGNTTQYEYNELGMLTKRNFPGDNDDSFTYFTDGRVKTAVNKDATISYEYDDDGRLINEIQNGKSISYSYDLNNLITRITYPSGKVITETSDVRGRLDKLSSVTDGAIVDLTYNSTGNLTQTSYKNGVVISYAYTNAKQTAITHKVGQSSPLLGYNMTYSNGILASEHRTDQSTKDMSYTYDAMARLTKAVQGTPQNKADNYSLDGLGNWLDWNGEKRTVNNLNQYTTINGTAYRYDRNGNLIEDDQNRYEYDYMNRIIKVTRKSDGKIVEYKYDARGRRIARISGGITIHYFYDQMGRVIEEQTDGITTAAYVIGNRPHIYTMTKGGKTYYYHQDLRGSVIKITDDSGNVVEEYQYDAYGNTTIYNKTGSIIPVSAIGNFYGFAGAMIDPDTGLYFMVNRYYHPRLGRFLSIDPVGYKNGGNLYEYASSDPINRIDWLGLSPEKCFKTQDIQWSANIWEDALSKIKLGGISITSVGTGLTVSISSCSKECCKDGQQIQSPPFTKGIIEGDLTASGTSAIPGWGFEIPKIGKYGFFATLDIFIKGSANYEEDVTKDCKIEYGSKGCITLGGNIGIQGGSELEDAVSAWVKGAIGLSGEVCISRKGVERKICLGGGVSIELKVTITWWEYGTNFNIFSGNICFGTEGPSGSYQFLNFETNYG